MAKFAVILPAAGKSNRFRDKEKKPFANLDGRGVWLRSAELFVTRSDVCQCLIVVAKEDQGDDGDDSQADVADDSTLIQPTGLSKKSQGVQRCEHGGTFPGVLL